VLGVDLFTTTLTIRASGLELLNKTRSKLAQLNANSMASASGALDYCSIGCAALTVSTIINNNNNRTTTLLSSSPSL
jgi:hypothetical protein